MTGTRRQLAALSAVGTLAAVGCVDRRFVVESNVPAAQISRDGTSLGPAPADGRYEYTGTYTFQAVAPGYETTTVPVRFKPRWYDYPPLDLIAEILPYRIQDVRRVRLDLVPARPVNQVELLGNAAALRARGLAMRESVVPDTPRDRPAPGPVPPPTSQPGPERPFQGNLTPPPPIGGDPGTQAQPGSAPLVGPGNAPGR